MVTHLAQPDPSVSLPLSTTSLLAAVSRVWSGSCVSPVYAVVASRSFSTEHNVFPQLGHKKEMRKRWVISKCLRVLTVKVQCELQWLSAFHGSNPRM